MSEKLIKPTMEKYGYHISQSFDDEPTGWMYEGGEEAYYKALSEYNQKALAMDNIESYTVLSTALQHGTECKKVEHVGGGYLHDGEDDTPYYVDGQKYCGRCHRGL